METVNGLFGTPTSQKGLWTTLNRAKMRVENPLAVYKRHKQQQAEQAAAKAEQERQEKLARIAEGTATPEEVLSEESGIEAPEPIEPTTTVTKSKDGSATLKTNADFSIHDLKTVCRAVADGTIPVDCVKVTLVKTKLKQYAKGCRLKGEKVNLPGVLITEKDGVSVSTKRKKKDPEPEKEPEKAPEPPAEGGKDDVGLLA
jgi:hypothetical protein